MDMEKSLNCHACVFLSWVPLEWCMGKSVDNEEFNNVCLYIFVLQVFDMPSRVKKLILAHKFLFLVMHC